MFLKYQPSHLMLLRVVLKLAASFCHSDCGFHLDVVDIEPFLHFGSNKGFSRDAIKP